MGRKNVFILGSTGTIGLNTLKVIQRFPEEFGVVGLTAFNNISLIEKQIKQFRPKYVAIHHDGISSLRHRINRSLTQVVDVEKDLADLVSLKEVDIVVIGMSGSAALKPFLNAVRHGKTVAPANKEALVIAGDIIMRDAQRWGAKIIPIDSEQSAIFQCLDGRNRDELNKVYLTASGGALYRRPKLDFDRLSVKEILNHPRWKMGKKITVDSATLMNKGFEIIEAKHLFGLTMDQIEVVIHPEAIIHSMVGFKDGSIMAQLGITDMRLPIQYALTYPRRLKTDLKELDFVALKKLTFDKPDLNKFPSLSLATHVGHEGGTLPCVLNAADEEAVNAFLGEEIPFSKIFQLVEKVVLAHKKRKGNTIGDLLEAEQWARYRAKQLISRER